MIYWQLFFSFLQIGAFSIGGGYAAMPLIQSQVVEKYGWLTMGQFTDLITIAEMTPGPIAVNSATFVGINIAGIPGAIIATMGCIAPSLIIVSVLAFIYDRFKGVSVLQSVLGSLRPAVVALIAGAGLSILQYVVFKDGTFSVSLSNLDFIGSVIFIGAFFVLRRFKWNPILVMLGCGVVGLAANLVMGLF